LVGCYGGCLIKDGYGFCISDIDPAGSGDR
jgi:hypothetical protein